VQTRATILVVEDDESMRELLRLHLRRAGYLVLCAEGAVAASHIVHERRPDLIVADVEMPHMDGIEFAQTVKSNPATSSIPFIFVSANADAEPQVRQVGAAAFVKKPFMAHDFLAAVARHVGGP